MSHEVAARAGLSLMETLMILAVLAVVVGLALPRLDSARFRAGANVHLVRSAVLEARRLSEQSGNPVLLSLDTLRGRIRIVVDSNASGGADQGESTEWRMLTSGSRFSGPAVGVSGGRANSVVGDSLKTLDAMPSLVFRGGAPASRLQIYIEVREGAGASRAVAVDTPRGLTRWYALSDKGWKEGK